MGGSRSRLSEAQAAGGGGGGIVGRRVRVGGWGGGGGRILQTLLTLFIAALQRMRSLWIEVKWGRAARADATLSLFMTEL